LKCHEDAACETRTYGRRRRQKTFSTCRCKEGLEGDGVNVCASKLVTIPVSQFAVAHNKATTL